MRLEEQRQATFGVSQDKNRCFFLFFFTRKVNNWSTTDAVLMITKSANAMSMPITTYSVPAMTFVLTGKPAISSCLQNNKLHNPCSSNIWIIWAFTTDRQHFLTMITKWCRRHLINAVCYCAAGDGQKKKKKHKMCILCSARQAAWALTLRWLRKAPDLAKFYLVTETHVNFSQSTCPPV